MSDDDIRREDGAPPAPSGDPGVPDGPGSDADLNEAVAEAYVGLLEWEEKQRRGLGVGPEVKLPQPPGFHEIMASDLRAMGADFDFDKYEVVRHGSEFRISIRRTKPLVPQEEERPLWTIMLPTPWLIGNATRVEEKQDLLLADEGLDYVESILQFVDGETGFRRFMTVPGLRCELQYTVDTAGRQYFLIRDGLSKVRVAALVCVLLEIMADPRAIAEVNGMHD